jgi:hypothetical protein
MVPLTPQLLVQEIGAADGALADPRIEAQPVVDGEHRKGRRRRLRSNGNATPADLRPSRAGRREVPV